MMDIVIYTNEEDFKHKTNKEVYGCYWEMKRTPKNFNRTAIGDVDVNLPDKVFLACKGFVRGCVELIDFDPDGWETLQWDGCDFKEIETQIPCKHFRGFRYRWW